MTYHFKVWLEANEHEPEIADTSETTTVLGGVSIYIQLEELRAEDDFGRMVKNGKFQTKS